MATETEIPEEFKKVSNDFVADILRSFPEYQPLIEKWWKNESSFSHIDDDQERADAFAKRKEKDRLFLYKFCTKKYPPRFFEILNQDPAIFDEESDVDTEFLPFIHFKNIWQDDISDETRETIWKYLQLILFSVVGSVKDKNVFGDAGEMFENMNRMKRYYGEAPPEFLLTHPVTSSRVNDAFNAAESIDVSGSKKDSLDYSFIRSRLKVYYEKIPASSVSYFKDAFKKSNLPSDHYGLALALNKNNEFENSISVINDLIDRFPKNLILNTTRVEIYLNAGLYQEASNHVDEFLSISPGNYPLTITKAKILNETGEYFAAEELLREQLLKRNGDPYLWLLLSDIQRDGKNVVGYYQSKAEYHFLLGQYEEAISQLEFALQLTKNNFQVSESVMTKIIDIKNKINKSRGL